MGFRTTPLILAQKAIAKYFKRNKEAKTSKGEEFWARNIFSSLDQAQTNSANPFRGQ